MKKKLSCILPRNKSAKFQPNLTIFKGSRLPQVVWVAKGPESGSQGPKNKIKKSSGIYPIYKRTKAQNNLINFKISRLPKNFGTHNPTHTFSDEAQKI